MDRKLRIFLVEDDPVIIELMRVLLESAGHIVKSSTSSVGVEGGIRAFNPDCIVTDLMMPGKDGFQLCRELRRRPEFDGTKIVVVTAKPYQQDKRRALELGADAYINKPLDPDAFVKAIERIVDAKVEVTFWGVRGTLPVPGENTLRYGGNTSCVAVTFPNGRFFIFDAGTGIKGLSDHLMATGGKGIEAKIFISHPHWDHINALPFFAPLYSQGNAFEILGASHADRSLRDMIADQMSSVYFPITVREFGAHVYYRELCEGEFEIAGIRVRTLLLSHPGKCLGYRIDYEGRVLCYVTDNELYPEWTPHRNEHFRGQLIDFVKQADALIIDSTYTDAEYKRKVNWGHSCLSEVVHLAHEAEVKTLYLFHHDPDQNDSDIDAKVTMAGAILTARKSTTICIAPSEKQTLRL